LLVTPGDYPRRKHLKGPPIGLALALPSNSKTQLERVSEGKPSSLLGLVISDEGKKFYHQAAKSSSSAVEFVSPNVISKLVSVLGKKTFFVFVANGGLK
jgi:hypothetical protein